MLPASPYKVICPSDAPQFWGLVESAFEISGVGLTIIGIVAGPEEQLLALGELTTLVTTKVYVPELPMVAEGTVNVESLMMLGLGTGVQV